MFLAAALAACTAAPRAEQAPGQTPAAEAPAPSTATDSALIAVGERHFAHVRQLTSGGNNAEAYFSPDGKQLIFQRQEAVDTGCDQEYIINSDGSNLHRVSNGQGRTTCGYFLDGGRRILYSSTYAYSPACPPHPDYSQGYVWPLGHFEIYTANADGSGLKPLTHNGAYNAETTASPDGKRLIFTSTKDGDIELYTMNTDGSDVRRITHRMGYDGGAFFSPDGSKILWRAQYPETAADTADYLKLLKQRLVRPSHLELWVANADGSDAHQITHLGGPTSRPTGTRTASGSSSRPTTRPRLAASSISTR